MSMEPISCHCSLFQCSRQPRSVTGPPARALNSRGLFFRGLERILLLMGLAEIEDNYLTLKALPFF